MTDDTIHLLDILLNHKCDDEKCVVEKERAHVILDILSNHRCDDDGKCVFDKELALDTLKLLRNSGRGNDRR